EWRRHHNLGGARSCRGAGGQRRREARSTRPGECRLRRHRHDGAVARRPRPVIRNASRLEEPVVKFIASRLPSGDSGVALATALLVTMALLAYGSTVTVLGINNLRNAG